MPKVSVIIPVYNAESYLERCLNSVCNQTLTDIEIICVDDCSTDSSLAILNNFVQKDKRIKLIKNKQNGGESIARNLGLINATGEYLGFVDNDDELSFDFYEKLYIKAKETNAEIVKGNSIEIDYDGNPNYTQYNTIIRENNNDKTFFTTHWWTAIYKRTLITENKISFLNDKILGADVLFLSEALVKSAGFEIVDDVYYIYHRRIDSGDSKYLSLEKVKSAMYVYEKVIENLTKYVGSIFSVNGYNYAINYYLIGIFYFLYRNEEDEARIFCIKTIFYIYSIIKNKDFIATKLFDEYPYILYFIKKNDTSGFLEFIRKNELPVSTSQIVKFRFFLKSLSV